MFVVKPNFGFQKRQKEQARERKKNEKAQRKLERGDQPLELEAYGLLPATPAEPEAGGEQAEETPEA